MAIIQDPTFAQLEREVMAQRKAWEKDMQLGQATSPSPKAPAIACGEAQPSKTPTVLEERTMRIANARAIIAGTAGQNPYEYWGPFPTIKGRHGVESFIRPKIWVSTLSAMEKEGELDTSSRLAEGQLTKEHLQDLALAFDKLRFNLDEAFLKASDLIGDPAKTKVSEPTQSLQRSLKILLMERLRSCLFFSWEIWADVASEKLPRSLELLAPEARAVPLLTTGN